ncbi:VOC family protein [Paenibacillus sp. SEL1]|uniref:VOC family protein n=1 Tax=Paenibacillus polymyxa TaxID=1406 RepID=A0AAE9IFT9_PAEPO|nr:VOC family protein [Paenibacillus polymyxa]AOK88323.1 glyoxalase [Paenibacillus polymyxa]URJ51838.1 VOC family protein [Paenibacillus polymyxa]
MAVKLKRLSIFVKEMKRSLDFYRTLGLEIPERVNEEHHIEVAYNDVILSFDTWESAQMILGDQQKPAGYRMEIAFQFDSKEALDESYSRLTVQGYEGHFEPNDTPWGERYAIIKDPDGNLISLVA